MRNPKFHHANIRQRMYDVLRGKLKDACAKLARV
jgi:hypothetical protein